MRRLISKGWVLIGIVCLIGLAGCASPTYSWKDINAGVVTPTRDYP